ncbi:MAG: D-sedoheptulose 7-phosphate isomerase [Methylovulum sp.]|nr:D-sedoheptulose 7-phosphate isomerase [Methylovulum sp.]
MADLGVQFVADEMQQSIETKQLMLADQSLLELIDEVTGVIVQAYQKGGKTMLAGNGGSAADAQHIAAELVNKLAFDRPALASVALTTDTSILTAIVNDSSVEFMFSRQVEANGKPDDVFIGISTSGNSANIIAALKKAREMGIVTVGLTGNRMGKMNEFCDYCLKVPSAVTPRIQECHILMGHIICTAIEERLFGNR